MEITVEITNIDVYNGNNQNINNHPLIIALKKNHLKDEVVRSLCDNDKTLITDKNVYFLSDGLRRQIELYNKTGKLMFGKYTLTRYDNLYEYDQEVSEVVE